jgi:hypothetical protein
MGNEKSDVGRSCRTFDKYKSAFKINSKCKAISLQTWKLNENSRKLRHKNSCKSAQKW